MKILLVEDDRDYRRVLARQLTGWGHEVLEAENGQDALKALLAADGPRLALIDWEIPGFDGKEVCRALREVRTDVSTYLIILTGSRTLASDSALAFEAGADDFILKPAQFPELRARLRFGERALAWQDELDRQARELREAHDDLARLRRLLPTCAHCRRPRDDPDYRREVERYLAGHAADLDEQSVCPACRRAEPGEAAHSGG